MAGESVFPAAEALADRGLPFLFATGYGDAGLSPAFKGHTVVTKPYRRSDLHLAMQQAMAGRG